MHSFVTAPERPPHKCISCFADTDRDWWLDLGEDLMSDAVEMTTVYLCNLCLIAIGKEKGIENKAPFLAEIEDLKSQLFNARTKAEALEIGLDGLLRARFVDPDSPAARELVSFLEADKSGEEDESGAGERVDSRAGEINQPSDVEDLGTIRPVFQLDGNS